MTPQTLSDTERLIAFHVSADEYDELVQLGVMQAREIDRPEPFAPENVALGILRTHLPGTLRLFGLERS